MLSKSFFSLISDGLQSCCVFFCPSLALALASANARSFSIADTYILDLMMETVDGKRSQSRSRVCSFVSGEVKGLNISQL